MSQAEVRAVLEEEETEATTFQQEVEASPTAAQDTPETTKRPGFLQRAKKGKVDRQEKHTTPFSTLVEWTGPASQMVS